MCTCIINSQLKDEWYPLLLLNATKGSVKTQLPIKKVQVEV